MRRSFLLAAAEASGVTSLAGASRPPAEYPRVLKWEELTASDLRAALIRGSLVYVPLGTLEFHGPHLPIGTDSIHAEEFCLAAAVRTGGVVLPAIPWSPHGNEKGPGSILVREETFNSLVTDILTRLAEQQVRWIVACTGHYPAKQEPAIRKLADEVMKRFPRTRIVGFGPWCHPRDPAADHAGKKETSLMLALRPKLVRMGELKHPGRSLGVPESALEASKAPHYGPYYYETSAGEATARFGREYFDAEVKRFLEVFSKTMQEKP